MTSEYSTQKKGFSKIKYVPFKSGFCEFALAKLEQHGLLISAWTGIEFHNLPEEIQSSIAQFLADLEDRQKWFDLSSLVRERVVDALIPCIDDNGCYDPQEIYEAIRCVLTIDPNGR